MEMQLTQEYIEAWTDSVCNAWQAQDTASELAQQGSGALSHDAIGAICGLAVIVTFVAVAMWMRRKKK